MSEIHNNIEPYARAVIALLKHDLSPSDSLWKDVEEYQLEIYQYLYKIGLELIFNAKDGYAFIRQLEIDDDGNTVNLLARRQLSFEVSLVCVLLREIYETFEMNPTNIMADQCYVSHLELKEQAEMFFSEGFNRVKFQKDLDKYISKTLELGYLKIQEEGNNQAERIYVVKPIIKARVTVEELLDLKEKMKQYVESV